MATDRAGLLRSLRLEHRRVLRVLGKEVPLALIMSPSAYNLLVDSRHGDAVGKDFEGSPSTTFEGVPIEVTRFADGVEFAFMRGPDGK